MSTLKTALITGATDGIGKATAKKLLAENWRVVILGRSAKKCEETLLELKKISQEVSPIVCDLSSLNQVNQAIDLFLKENRRLDFLCLNANAIANKRELTQEGHEKNFAVGYLSRALMIKRFERILNETENSQILSVIGMDFTRIDFNDLTIEKNFTGRKGLTRWQWAMNVFARAFAETNAIPLTLYMPGLVKTKILADEPQPMRAFVKLMNLLMGISVEVAADNIFYVLSEVSQKHLKGRCYSWRKPRALPKIEQQPGDQEKLILLTEKLLRNYI